jgi:hypothetical protein
VENNGSTIFNVFDLPQIRQPRLHDEPAPINERWTPPGLNTGWPPSTICAAQPKGISYGIPRRKYSVVQGALPNVWKWRVLVGRPEMLRMGEAERSC